MADNITVAKLPSGWLYRIGISIHGCERFVDTRMAQVGITYTRDEIEAQVLQGLKDSRFVAVELFRGKLTLYANINDVMLTMRYTEDARLLVITMHDHDRIEGLGSGIAIARKKLKKFTEQFNRRQAAANKARIRNNRGYKKLLRRILYGKNKQR